MIDWSIDFLKTASGASEVYEVDYTSALLEEGGHLPEKVLRSSVPFINRDNFRPLS